jgi:DNA-binding transcriptional MerR regulator
MTEIDEGTPSAGAYRREDVRRIADVTERQLRSWEKQGLVGPRAGEEAEPQENFGFSDLLALKTLKKLRELHITPKQIQRAITSLKSRLEDIDHPLAQLRITAEGRRITVHVAGT